MKRLYGLLIEPSYKDMLIQMGATEQVIYKFMRKRILLTIITFAIFLASYFVIKSVIVLIVAFLAAALIYYNDYKQMKTRFTLFSFEKELQFSKFARLIGPYLKKNEGNVPLYAVFNRVLHRLDPAIRGPLYQLMSEMVTKPNDIAPFLNFAKQMGNNDFAVTFMTSLYDYQHSTNDLTVIDELVQIANESLMKNIDIVIEFKLRKYRTIPTLFTASIIVVLLGFFVAMFLDMGSQIGNLASFGQ